MKNIAIALVLASLTHVGCTVSSTPVPTSSDAAVDAAVDAPAEASAACRKDTGTCVCPEDFVGHTFFENRPGEACSVPQGTECFGNAGASGVFLRCCDGVWIGPPDGGGSGAAACP